MFAIERSIIAVETGSSIGNPYIPKNPPIAPDTVHVALWIASIDPVLLLFPSDDSVRDHVKVDPVSFILVEPESGSLRSRTEFQLAADIVGTIVSPTMAHLVELGAIALIRTFLNYFLGKELNEDHKVLNERVEIKKKVMQD